ncbi:MAG: hypothetical protein AAF196_07740 [Planctomycetota bacterium]
MQLSQQNLSEFTFCDADLLAIRWTADGRDFSLDLILGDERSANLTCTWAAGVRVDLRADSSELGGPLSTECRWTESADGWQMSFAFGSRGVIELRCQEAVLTYNAG